MYMFGWSDVHQVKKPKGDHSPQFTYHVGYCKKKMVIKGMKNISCFLLSVLVSVSFIIGRRRKLYETAVRGFRWGDIFLQVYITQCTCF